MNKDMRFAQNTAFVFASVAYIEKSQIQRNMGVSFNRGTAKTDANGDVVYSLDDPFSVLGDIIKNTPRYWQKARYLLYHLHIYSKFSFKV